ncbi:hypothetical protein F4819DRAFT_236224 [Hypoxylon fuscum]|nr:hypothetical protein F4819DRAFT_236224 [Hypoxylon fuscum]
MSNEWFSEKLAPDGNVEDGCHPNEAQAMKKYLRHEFTAQEAARAITQPIENAENPGHDLPRLWDFLMDALIELPSETTESLIELLQAIENLPEPDMTAIEEKKRPSHGKLWRGLPGFAHLYADIHQLGDSGWRALAVKADGPEQDRIRNYQVRKADIEARLAVLSIAGITIDWGYETVADALEKSDALLDFEVPAAAAWFARAGERFKEGAANGEESWALDRQRDLWKGGKSMTPKRYEFWVQRMSDWTNMQHAL